MRVQLWQKVLSGERHQMATAVSQRSYIQSSVLGWSALSDLKDKGCHTYANFCFSSHASWKILVSFLRQKCMSTSHLLFPLNSNSCFLASLLVNLKVFRPFSQNWCSDNDAQLIGSKGGDTYEPLIQAWQDMKQQWEDLVTIRGTSLQITFSAQRWIKH